jgi:hypothetical protein
MRIDRIFFLSTLLAFAAFAQDAGPSVDEVINKTIEARGGIDHLKAIEATRMTIDKAEANVAVDDAVFKMPAKPEKKETKESK